MSSLHATVLLGEVFSPLHLADADFFPGDPSIFLHKGLVFGLLLEFACFDGELESIVTLDCDSHRVVGEYD